MILRKGVNRFAWTYSLQASPSNTPGVTITPANGSKGNYSQLASGANLTQDVWGMWLQVNGGATSTAARPIRLDIGIDPAGGTSYTRVLIPDILCGASASPVAGGGYFYFFPVWIKSGQSVGARAQGIETATFRVVAKFYGRPTRPDLACSGQWVETVGTPSGADGVAITPGTSSEGAWTSVGTSTRQCWWWQISGQINNGTITALSYFLDLAYGTAGAKVVIQENIPFFATGTTEQLCLYNGEDGTCDVPAGSTIYARVHCSGTPVSGFTVLAHGVGG